MVKSDKNKIKETFFHLLDLTKNNDIITSELHQNLITRAVIHSISMDADIIHPIFLMHQHNSEEIRLIERKFPEYFNLITNTTSLRNVYTDIEILTTKKRQINFNSLIDIHKDIFRRSRYNIAGKLRSDKTSDTIYAHPLPHPSIVPEQMEQHFDWLYDRLAQHKKITPSNLFEHIYISAEMHFRVAVSMPFEYGNGIMARLITDYILMSRKIFFPVVDYSTKERYMKALKNTKVDNYRELTDYFIEMFENTLCSVQGFIELANDHKLNHNLSSESEIISTKSN